MGLFSAQAPKVHHDRRIYVNLPVPADECDLHGRPHVAHLPGNAISTAKYTWYTFVPKNLFEQFRRVANLYFLMTVILQIFPQFEVSNPLLAAMPLIIIISITAIKDGFEDWRRHTTDSLINNSVTRCLGGWVNVNFVHRAVTTPHGRKVGTLTELPMDEDQEETEDGDRFPGGFTETQWKLVRIGDILLLRADDRIPADCLIMSTSGDDGVCFVETKGLDGETNLKAREALRLTSHICTARECRDIRFVVETETPTMNLYIWDGRAGLPLPGAGRKSTTTNPHGHARKGSTSSGRKGSIPAPAPQYHFQPITAHNILLRGSALRNTTWVIALVLATGADTKCLKNAGTTPSKRSRIEKLMNPQVGVNFLILIVMCVTVSLLQGRYKSQPGMRSAPWVDWSESTGEAGVFTFFAAMIMLQNVVPISLYITIEGVKTIQAYFIYSDHNMYHAPSDTACTPKSWNMSDDLGQIEYLFSDKTGTLTQNKMEFMRCCIDGVAYGQGFTDVSAEQAGLSLDEREARMQVMQEEMKASFEAVYEGEGKGYLGKDLSFVDDRIWKTFSSGYEKREKIATFFTSLALCHTVLPPKHNIQTESATSSQDMNTPTANIIYSAQSPDEQALVTGAKDCGVTFLDRVQDVVVLDVYGKIMKWRVLNILEFTSSRRRMGVVVQEILETEASSKGEEESDRSESERGYGDIWLIVKGADTAIYPLLTTPTDPAIPITFNHLESFATEGLRTLLLASRKIPPDEYAAFSQAYHQASCALVDRENLLSQCFVSIEKGLSLVGASAIEDRLQDGVPEVVGRLREAGIRVWVLTGDKIETAINIGFASNLLSGGMTLVIIKGSSGMSSDVEKGNNMKPTHQMTPSQQLSEALRVYFPDAVHDKPPGFSYFPFARRSSVAPAEYQKRVSLAALPQKSQIASPQQPQQPQQEIALIIDGDAIHDVMESKENQMNFLKFATRCKSVICCRVSPKQKAQCVKLVKKGQKVMCLAVGDGANDVSMIQEAHVGVGIAGQEGLQAAMASDYVIAQFRYLERLLLVHGHWSYFRVARTVLSFFYKNLVWVFTLFWFQLYCGFTAQLLYDYTYLMFFNLFFTSLPPLILGIFDQDIPASYLLSTPPMYTEGIRQTLFTMKAFWIAVLDALYQSAIIFFGCYLTFGAYTPEGADVDLKVFGTVVALCVIWVVNLGVGMEFHNWTWIVFGGIALSILAFMLYIPIYAIFPGSLIPGVEKAVFEDLAMWAILLWTIIVALAPRVILLSIRSFFCPGDKQIVRERAKYNMGPPVVPGGRRRTLQFEEGELPPPPPQVDVPKRVSAVGRPSVDEPDKSSKELPRLVFEPQVVESPEVPPSAETPLETVDTSSPGHLRVTIPARAPRPVTAHHQRGLSTPLPSALFASLSTSSIVHMDTHIQNPNTGFAFSADEPGHDHLAGFSTSGLQLRSMLDRRATAASASNLGLPEPTTTLDKKAEPSKKKGMHRRHVSDDEGYRRSYRHGLGSSEDVRGGMTGRVDWLLEHNTRMNAQRMLPDQFLPPGRIASEYTPATDAAATGGRTDAEPRGRIMAVRLAVEESDDSNTDEKDGIEGANKA
ncbi:hypothetical protein HDU85_001720 [Gaertneriomyces sp. JEL0708]|nr:hypothetical protein HDU85_001720 [Gaertneriomyces sp. JEL0708]